MKDVADGDGGPRRGAVDLGLLEGEAALASEDAMPGLSAVVSCRERAGEDVEGGQVADRGEGFSPEAVARGPVVARCVLAREVGPARVAARRAASEELEVRVGDAVARVVAADGPRVEVD